MTQDAGSVDLAKQIADLQTALNIVWTLLTAFS
jgi:hypothetical protein